MIDEAQVIFDYLPINKNTIEEEYITHLWNSFSSLLNSELIEAKPFCLMPFHLLFMLALQYKVLRIAKYKQKDYQLIYTIKGLRNDQKNLLTPTSPFIIALLKEKEIANIFLLLNVKQELILSIRNLIEERNDNLAHAKGSLNSNFENKIYSYINCLEKLQPYFVNLNDIVAEKWLPEIRPYQNGLEYVEAHMLEEYICPADMKNGKLANIDEKINKYK